MSGEHSSNPNYKLQKKLMRKRAIRESWPLLVWLGVAVLAVWAYQTGGEFQRMRGVVSKPIEKVRAPLDGVLVGIPTDDPGMQIPRDTAGQPVKLEQGTYVNRADVVAKLDDTQLKLQRDAEVQTADFNRSELLQKLQQQVLDFNRVVFDLKNERTRLEDQIAGYEQLQIKLEAEVRTGQALASALEAVKQDISGLTADLASVDRNLEETEKNVTLARQGIEEFRTKVDIQAEELAMVKLLDAQMAQASIKAGQAGFIDKIYAQPGTFVRRGDPIMDIVIKAPKTITAMIPEAESLTMKVGDTVYIAIPNNRKQYVTATVVSLQQSLTQLPDVGSGIRDRMRRGRLVEFGNLNGGEEGESQLPLLPGSEVVISLDKPGRIPFLSWFTE